MSPVAGQPSETIDCARLLKTGLLLALALSSGRKTRWRAFKLSQISGFMRHLNCSKQDNNPCFAKFFPTYHPNLEHFFFKVGVCLNYTTTAATMEFLCFDFPSFNSLQNCYVFQSRFTVFFLTILLNLLLNTCIVFALISRIENEVKLIFLANSASSKHSPLSCNYFLIFSKVSIHQSCQAFTELPSNFFRPSFTPPIQQR